MAQEEMEPKAGSELPEEDLPLEPEMPIRGGIRQIQKILVEPRARQLEESVEALDRRRAKDLAELRKEMDRGISRCDDFIKSESSVLADRLTSERKERKRGLEDKAKDMQGELRAIEERLSKFEEQAATEMRDLRQKILDQYREYSGELQTWRDEMADAIARELSGVRAEKADRSTLAKLLAEVGERIASGSGDSVTTH